MVRKEYHQSVVSIYWTPNAVPGLCPVLEGRYTCTSVTLLVCSSACSVISDSATPRTIAHQAPLSMGFFRQEYWSGLPYPPPGDLLNPGIESTSPVSPSLQGDSLPLRHWGSLRPKLHEDKHHLSLKPERTKQNLRTAHDGEIQITETRSLWSSGHHYGGHGSRV